MRPGGNTVCGAGPPHVVGGVYVGAWGEACVRREGALAVVVGVTRRRKTTCIKTLLHTVNWHIHSTAMHTRTLQRA